MRPACWSTPPRGAGASAATAATASAARAIAPEMRLDGVEHTEGAPRGLVLRSDLERAHQFLPGFAPAARIAEAPRQFNVPERVRRPQRDREPELLDGLVAAAHVGQGLAEQQPGPRMIRREVDRLAPQGHRAAPHDIA